jgi:hypothetical protein
LIFPFLKLPYATTPNGIDRNLRVARKLKPEGVGGVDVAVLCLPDPQREYHGLYLEMKSE